MTPPAFDPTAATGLVAATLTTLCWLPQAVKTIRTRDARALSLPTQVGYTLGIGLWLAYGLMIRDMPLILSNTVTFALAATILTLKLRYG